MTEDEDRRATASARLDLQVKSFYALGQAWPTVTETQSKILNYFIYIYIYIYIYIHTYIYSIIYASLLNFVLYCKFSQHNIILTS